MTATRLAMTRRMLGAFRSTRSSERKPDPLIVLANRAPFRHVCETDGATRVTRSASGLVTALEPLVESTSGTWVAHGDAHDLKCADARGRLTATSNGSPYRIRYVGCGAREYAGFYNGFANEALWPLCHDTGVAPIFRMADYRRYSRANRRFARAVSDESVGRSPVVLVQDYHFALAPQMIRRLLPGSAVVAFWHIPWPSVTQFASCPWHRELLDGLLGSDIVGLQTEKDCLNFLDAAAALPGCDVDHARQRVEYRGRWIRVRAYPVGVRWNPPLLQSLPQTGACRERVVHDLGLPAGVRIGVGVDRLDYTKGIAEKFQAIERLLENRPDLRGSFTFVQVAEPSRETVPAYQQVRTAIREACARVNARFGTPGYRPIVMLEQHLDAADVYRLYRAADVCFVNSLDDGMNLVAKEFVSARGDGRGVLVLSENAGASRQLTAALSVDPRAIDQCARALARALDMPPGEQATRIRAMRTIVEMTDSTWWAREILQDAVAARTQAAPVRVPRAWPVPSPLRSSVPART